MKTAQERDYMVNSVNEAVEKWPTFEDMPISTETKVVSVKVDGDPKDNRNYVEALYALCSLGSIPLGRREGQNVIVGDVYE